MLNNIGLYFMLAIVVVSCGGSSEEPLPTMAFSEIYKLEDFNLAEDVEYWEIRIGPLPGKDLSEFSVRRRYGEIDDLDDMQRELLQSTTSQRGFDAECAPSFCPIYAISIAGYDVAALTSPGSLVEFFGDIDTEAELYIYLDYSGGYAPSTQPLTYEKVDDGYLVVLQWDSLCQRRGRDLVRVHPDGTLEKIREIDTETYSSCV